MQRHKVWIWKQSFSVVFLQFQGFWKKLINTINVWQQVTRFLCSMFLFTIPALDGIFFSEKRSLVSHYHIQHYATASIHTHTHAHTRNSPLDESFQQHTSYLAGSGNAATFPFMKQREALEEVGNDREANKALWSRTIKEKTAFEADKEK